MSGWWPSFALAGVLSSCLALGGCCGIEVDLDPPNPIGRNEPPDDEAPADAAGEPVGLGTAEYPGTNSARRTSHPWWLPDVKPSRYELGYKLADVASEDIHAAFVGFARQVGHARIDANRFQWRPPARCQGGLHCVYEKLEEGSVEGVEPIAQLFRKRAAAAHLSASELAELVLSFVQEIEYRVPEDEPFGVMPPALVVRNRWGDCDSKTLLANMVLRSLGIRSVLISSEAHKHTMLGVALPAPGTSFTYQGTRYAFVELTAKRSPIGHINPKLLRPNDWRVVAMRYKAPGPPPSPADAGDGERDDAGSRPSTGGRTPRGGQRGGSVLGGGRIKVR